MKEREKKKGEREIKKKKKRNREIHVLLMYTRPLFKKRRRLRGVARGF
jgi:hypothetical protein